MKNYLIGLFALSVVLVACAPKVVETVTPSAEATNEMGAMPSEAISGKQIFGNKCTGCHEAKTIKSYSQLKWASILPDMIERAELNESEGRQVTAYVNWELKRD